MRRFLRFSPASLLPLAVLSLLSALSALSAAAEEIPFTEGLAAGPLGRYGRSAVFTDPVVFRIATGRFETPVEGALLVKKEKGREVRWRKITADEKGWFKGRALRGGYLYAVVPSDEEQVLLLEAAGHSMVYANGHPRGGDVYAYGWGSTPVHLRKGENTFLFRVSRGRLRAKLVSPRAPVQFSNRDLTLPDLLLWDDAVAWGAVQVVNTKEQALRGWMIRSTVEGGPPLVTELPVVGPLTSRKAGFRIRPPVSEATGTKKLRLELLPPEGPAGAAALDTLETTLNVRAPGETHTRTFLSKIDGSVQYFAVTPGTIEGEERPALFLTCHGAGVEALGQARVYKPKTWGHVVAPTNRRPFGFDWEDWGRLDALEVLEAAQALFHTDPDRTYLTGHSMGGHGTWFLGAVYPGRFAAIAPSAGWYSFFSYGGKQRDPSDTPRQELFARASNPSDTLELARNFLHYGIYILHGEKDDNVPVEQARFMRKLLGGFHPDFAYYEKPGVKHWWGNACCDWPPLFDFLKHHVRPSNRDTRTVEFHTANPGISARSRWVTIVAQEHALRFSTVKITQDVKARTFEGETKNVSRLEFGLAHLETGEKVTVTLDGQAPIEVETPEGTATLRLERRGGTWRPAGEWNPAWKNPERYGTFKDAFRHRFLLVYGTAGTDEENAACYDKARFDAETFWYRGNGSVDVVSDKDFDPQAEPDRSVILYGNADTNTAWAALLAEGPVQVTRGAVAVGPRTFRGPDLVCLFVRPRPGSDRASVGAVAFTGLQGAIAAVPNPYLVSGSGYPDLLLYGADMLVGGFDGVWGVGYFGEDWNMERGQFAWRER